MEVSDALKILLIKIRLFEKEHPQKILGFILLRYPPEAITKFALASDRDIISLITEAKKILESIGCFKTPHKQLGLSQPASLLRPLPMSVCVAPPFVHPQLSNDQVPLGHNLVHHSIPYVGPSPLPSSQSSPEGNYLSAPSFAEDIGSKISLGPQAGLSELPNQQCHFFMMGCCKNGSSCRFSHGQGTNDSHYDEDCAFPHASLENLEIEIVELLKSKGGIPISIEALPLLFHGKYGKALQSDGYLTESQRHGEIEFSWTRLLARFKNTIRIIEGQDGQHSVILAEDAPSNIVHTNERIDQTSPSGSSHKIYLTFPADSSFTEDDVFEYFNQYGRVRDVMIPNKTERMFGFVRFFYPETVRLVLSMRHHHNICGDRVLAKPYKDKNMDKNNTDVVEPSGSFLQYLDTPQLDPDAKLLALDNLKFPRGQKIEDRNYHAAELARKQLLDIHLASQNDPKVDDSTAKKTSENSSDHSSDSIQLPDSPFSYTF